MIKFIEKDCKNAENYIYW